MDEEDPAEAAILRLVAERGGGKTICPSEAARALDPELWRARLREVRAVAVRLAGEGRVAIYRKGRPVDPNAFSGVYRIGAPPDAASGRN